MEYVPDPDKDEISQEETKDVQVSWVKILIASTFFFVAPIVLLTRCLSNPEPPVIVHTPVNVNVPESEGNSSQEEDTFHQEISPAQEQQDSIQQRRHELIGQIDLAITELDTLDKENACIRAQYIFQKEIGLEGENRLSDSGTAANALVFQVLNESNSFAKQFTTQSRLGGDAVSQQRIRPFIEDQRARLLTLRHLLTSNGGMDCPYLTPVSVKEVIDEIYYGYELLQIELIKWRESQLKQAPAVSPIQSPSDSRMGGNGSTVVDDSNSRQNPLN